MISLTIRRQLPMKKICYYPELVAVTESITAALMMSQLEFWFKAREGRSFYKFLEPCEHERYKEGDSWQEELGMSSSEIRSAFKKIGMPYKSKKAFNEAENIFQGKYYASYYDRIRKVTYYFRNTSKVKAIFDELDRAGRGSGCLECMQNEVRQVSDQTEVREVVGLASTTCEKSIDEVVEAKDAYLPNLKDESSIATNQQDGLCIQDNNQDFIYDNQLRQQVKESITQVKERIKQVEVHIPYLEILKVYNEELGAYLGAKERLSTSEKERIKHLWLKLGKGVEDFRVGFHKVTESSFLCGRLEGKLFKASLAWLLEVEHFKRILAGSYDDFQSQKYGKGAGCHMQKIAQFNQMASHEDWDFEEIERLERAYIDHKLAHDQQQRVLKDVEKSQMQDGEGVGEGKWASIEI